MPGKQDSGGELRASQDYKEKKNKKRDWAEGEEKKKKRRGRG